MQELHLKAENYFHLLTLKPDVMFTQNYINGNFSTQHIRWSHVASSYWVSGDMIKKKSRTPNTESTIEGNILLYWSNCELTQNIWIWLKIIIIKAYDNTDLTPFTPELFLKVFMIEFILKKKYPVINPFSPGDNCMHLYTLDHCWSR